MATATKPRPSREERARQINLRGVLPLGSGLFAVPSTTRNGSYEVSLRDQTCTCADFEYRGGPCVHLIALNRCASCGGPLEILAGASVTVAACTAAGCGWAGQLRRVR